MTHKPTSSDSGLTLGVSVSGDKESDHTPLGEAPIKEQIVTSFNLNVSLAHQTD